MENQFKLKPVVNNPTLWPLFLEYLNKELVAETNSLENAHDRVAIHRAQGAIFTLKRILKLRDEVNATTV